MRRRWKPLARALVVLRDAHSQPETALSEAFGVLTEAAFVVGGARHQPPRRQVDAAFAELARCALRGPTEAVRRDATYTLGHWGEVRACRVLLAVLGRTSEDATVRGLAAEGLASALASPRARARYEDEVTQALTSALSTASPEVRFWSVFAVGQLRLTSLRADLERLAAGDHEECPHMWKVSTEARDVLSFWDTGRWPSRLDDETTDEG
jgi:hypothetical protein